MDDKDIINEEDSSCVKDGMVHLILSHSYVVFLYAVILGAIFHTVFNFHIFQGDAYQYIGFVMIILGSILIYWAQSASASTAKTNLTGDKTERDFEGGPYKYSRNPTHIGMTIMTLGLGLIVNSFFIFLFIIIASIVTKFIFLKKEELFLEKKYGAPYIAYKNKVRSWL